MKIYNYPKTNKADLEAKHLQNEEIVLDAVKKLGGFFQMRVMEFRRHLREPMRETHIKEALRRLVDKGVLRLTTERCDSRGHAYRLIYQDNLQSKVQAESLQML
ncbi:MAG: hypothetical protein ACO3FL_04435 [Ilumatobacteraceae bacterium]